MAPESERASLVREMFSSSVGARSRRAADLYTEDTRLFVPLGIDQGLYEGRGDVTAYWRQFNRTWRSWQGEIRSLTEVGDSVHCTVDISGSAGAEGFPAETKLHFCAYFVDRKIAAATFYAEWMSPRPRE